MNNGGSTSVLNEGCKTTEITISLSLRAVKSLTRPFRPRARVDARLLAPLFNPLLERFPGNSLSYKLSLDLSKARERERFSFKGFTAFA
jgi:hypothetical protein